MLFRRDKGIIYALDYVGADALVSGVEETKDLDGIVAYKLGIIPVLSIDGGLRRATELVRQHTNLPVIYDQQKLFYACNDDGEFTIPPTIAKMLQETRIEAGIVLGMGNDGICSWYKEHLRAFIEAFLEHSVIPIVAAHLTTPDYLVREGGYIPDDVPDTSFRLVAGMGVKHFVIPGNKPRDARHYVEMLSGLTNPEFIVPGFGIQGGNEEEIFGLTKSKPTYLVVGPIDRIRIGEYYRQLESRLLV